MQNIKEILRKYDVYIQDGKREDFYFMKKTDLQKIAELDCSILDSNHNNSPTIEEFINVKKQIFFDGRIEQNNGNINIDVDTAYIPLEYNIDEFNKISNKIGYSADTIEKVSVNYKDYICFWWD